MKTQPVSSTAERIEALTLCRELLSGPGLKKHRSVVREMLAEMKGHGFEAGYSSAGGESMEYGQGPVSRDDTKESSGEKTRVRPAPQKLTYIPPAL